MPIVEIATWYLTDAYYEDPTIIDRGIDFLKKTDGVQSIYWGLVEENLKRLFIFIIWETLEHHKAIMDRPGYPGFIGFLPSIGEGASMKHVKFLQYFVPALTAPTTEILLMTLKNGKTRKDLDDVLYSLGEKINNANSKYAPVAWGETLESPSELYLLVGWESSKVHAEIVGQPSFESVVKGLPANAKLEMVHAKLKKVFPVGYL